MLDSEIINATWNQLFNFSRNGIWILDRAGKVVVANDVLLKWLEIKDIAGRDWQEFAREASESDEMEIASHSGVVRRVEWTSEPIKASDGSELGTLQIFADQSTAKAFEHLLVSEIKSLAKLAGEDPLTGLANRRAFESSLEHIKQEQAKRFGVIILDLDDFKTINDSFGHDVGDKVLKVFCDRLKSLVREGDLVARIGGDEFAILLPNITISELSEVADRIKRDVNLEIEENGKQLLVFVSMGYAHSGPNAEDVVKRADEWMYEHKAKKELKGLSALAEESSKQKP